MNVSPQIRYKSGSIGTVYHLKIIDFAKLIGLALSGSERAIRVIGH